MPIPSEETDSEKSLSNRELMAWLWPLFRPHLAHFGGALLLLLISSGLVIVGPVLIKHAIDVNISQADLEGLYFTVLLFLGVQLAQMIVSYGLRNWLEWVGQRMMADLRKDVFAHLIELPLSYHDSSTPGKLLSRVESDTQALRMMFTTTSVMLFSDILLFIGMFVVMYLVSPMLTALLAFLLPCIVGTTFYFQKKIHPLFLDVRKKNAEISGKMTEFIQAMPVLQSFARTRWALREFFKLNQAKYEVGYHGEQYIVLWFNLLFLFEATSFTLILGVGGYWALYSAITIGTLAMFLGYVRRFFDPLKRLSEQIAVIQKAFVATERIFALLQEPQSFQAPDEPLAWPGVQQSIKFEHVWFRYREETEWILKDVSFEIPAGDHWALVGPTGSVKTTIVSLMLRFYDPQQGRILIDGIDLKELEPKELRKHIGLVLQDIYLFPGDLQDNLTMGKDYSLEALRNAAKVTLADRFVEQLPKEYHADLSERGANLSVGQRQLLSFTRALLKDPQILILDEATSAVDPATEALLSQATQRLLTGRTALIIAHRLSTIQQSDVILVLQHGEIIQQGSHNELIEQRGMYQDLCRLQFSKYNGKPHDTSPQETQTEIIPTLKP